MSFKIKATAVTVATSLVAVPLALSGTAFAQDDTRPTGYIGGTVFNDLNGDGKKQDNEPGIPDVPVMVKGENGNSSPYYSDNYGNWLIKRADLGHYQVSYVDSKLANTTPSTVEVDLKDAVEGVNFGLRGGSICGTGWSDTNEDGKRQDGEPVLSGRRIYLAAIDKLVETGADGGYCFDNLPAGDYELTSTKNTGDPLVLTKPYGDSKFNWITTKTYVYKVGKGEQVKGIDAGFIKLRPDLKAVQIVVTNPYATNQDTFKVGDTIDVYGSLWANGNAPESLSGTLTLPEGVRIVGPIGGLAPGAIVQGQQVILPHGLKQSPLLGEFLGAKVVVEKEFTGGEIKWEVGNDNADTDLSNNVLTRKINAVAGQPQGDPAPKAPQAPEIKKVAALANTGADPVGVGAVGLGALVLGGLALFGARRRKNV
ncbi:SdrD B-like domain-containing protein [Lentzea sp. NPDC005914]|uniref:SdrD B-like domain-containing protein n=1 Tax=Lentzea sp. NPDC005914 TaxID=3154572 RepID=UPI003409E80F